MQQVLSTTTSAEARSSAGSIPSAASRPAMRSESCSFIWHPNVRTKKRRVTSPLYGPTVRPRPRVGARHRGDDGPAGMHITFAAIALAALATLVRASIQGAIGFGMNLVTVPVLALVLPDSLPVTVVFLGIPISIAMLRHEHRALDREGIGWIIGGRVPGTILGAWIVATAATETRSMLIGTFVLVFVGASITFPPVPVRASTQVAAGAVSGVTGTAAGIGGPPIALLYQHHPGPAMRSTLAATFFFGTLLSLGTLALANQVSGAQLLLGLGLAPLVLAGSYAGRRLHTVLDRGWMRPAVLVFAAL